ncbi:MAG: hypothetical protein ACI8UO_000428 [Verrucomicrobiales bacterium]|jgi:uncharacterized protein (TIGR02596 family)
MNFSANDRNRRRSRQGGFSLAEMMVVITIIAFLLALSAPNIMSLLRGSELATQGELFKNQLSQGQQIALSTNADVEIRFFKFADKDDAQVKAVYQAYQFYQYNDDGLLTERSELFRLNAPVIFHDNPKFTNLFRTQSVDEGVEESGTVDQAPKKFGSGVSSATYRSFRFRPDGSTDLPKGEKIYFVTLVQEQGANQTDPKNFYCIQIDPYNGSLREYRP